MRILVAGGFGYIGGRVSEHLALLGHSVILGSRFNKNLPNWLPEGEVVQLLWGDREALEVACKGIDVVIHAAGMNAGDCACNPIAALESNGVQTARLSIAARSAKVKKFIYFSTAHIYSNTLSGVITEKSCPNNLHPYATSHLAAENAVLSICESGPTRATVIRLANAFGRPVDQEANCWTLLVNDLCRQAVEKQMLELKTTGSQYRNFICLNDVCRLIEILCAQKKVSNKSTILNIGSSASQTIVRMAQLIQERSNQVLGLNPILKYPCEGLDIPQERLEYLSLNLDLIGAAALGGGNISEIDDLLRYCKVNFTAQDRA